jgi:hypothetical protein
LADVKLIVPLGCILVVELRHFQRAFKAVAFATGVFLAGCVTSYAVDSFVWGRPIVPSLEHVKYSLALLNQSKLNVREWRWYFTEGMVHLVTPAVAAFVPLGIFSSVQHFQVSVPLTFSLVLYSSFPQKNTEIMRPWMPVLIFLAVSGMCSVQ